MTQTLHSNPLPQQEPGEPPIVTLCRWLTVLDRWATFYEVDPAAEKQPTREHLHARDRAQALYLLKERALQALHASESPTVQLGVLTGPPSKASLWLCDECRSQAYALNISPRAYAEQTGGCKRCKRSGDPDYFSLYVLRVDYAPIGLWQFFTPVPLGREYFPAPRSAECPVFGERPTGPDGRFLRLGEPLKSEERQQFPEAEVVYQVWNATRAVSEGSG